MTNDDIRDKGLDGLRVIVEAISRHHGTGQGKRLVRFLAGLYNGQRFPFDLTELRGLDTRLSDACMALLQLDLRGEKEVHAWGIVDGDQLNEWFDDGGLYYDVQRRRIGRELYDQKYGENGHPDEGLKA